MAFRSSGMLLPGGQRFRPRRELGVGRNPAQLLLPREDALAHGVPAIVELAFVLVSPLLEDVVRAVDAARRPVHQERLVGRRRALLLRIQAMPLVRHVLGQVVFLAVRRSRSRLCSRTSAGSHCDVSPARKP